MTMELPGTGLMRAVAVSLAAIALAVTACGGSEARDTITSDQPVTEPTTQTAPAVTEPAVTEATLTEPAVTEPAEAPTEVIDIFSDDEDLGVRYSGREGDPEVTARLLDFSEWPMEVAGGDNVPGVKIFELEPDGAMFDEPVTVTRRLDISAFESLDLGPFDVPLVTMLTQNDDGDFEVLDDLSILRIGPDLYVSGTTTHFSPIIISNENRMIPFLPGKGDGSAPATPFEDDPDAPNLADVINALLLSEINSEVIAPQRLDFSGGAEILSEIYQIAAPRGEPAPDTTQRNYWGMPLPNPGEDFPPIEFEPVYRESEAPTPEDGAHRAGRFGTQFEIPISWLPSTSTLLDASEGTVEVTAWAIIAIVPDSGEGAPVEVPVTEPPVTEPPVTEPPVTDPPVTEPSVPAVAPPDADVEDCLMYLDNYDELLDKFPDLTELCKTDTTTAREIIGEFLEDMNS